MTDQQQPLFMYTIDEPESGSHRVYASFLPHEVAFQSGLPPVAIVGQVMSGSGDLDPAQFAVNSAFVEFLHACIAKHAAQCPGLVAEAARQQDGYVYVVDARTPEPQGKVPPEDVIGAVAVAAGVMKGYEPNPNHRVLTVDGVVALNAWLFGRLQAELLQLVAGHEESS